MKEGAECVWQELGPSARINPDGLSTSMCTRSASGVVNKEVLYLSKATP